MKNSLPLIGLTLGEPAGIGPEICLKALKNSSFSRLGRFLIIGNLEILKKAAFLAKVNPRKIISVAEKNLKKINFKKSFFYLLDLKDTGAKNVKFGWPNAVSGRLAKKFLTKAAELARAGKIQAVVTSPISKANIQKAGFKFPGQTEFFAEKFGVKKFAMLFSSPKLRVILVTIHLPLKEVPSALTTEKIYEAIKLGAEFLKHLGVKKPRIAVAGLNPHAGEAGVLGAEENEIILPAVTRAAKAGLAVIGPASPDVIFKKAAGGEYDLVVAMYHDQALIPLKLLAFEKAVNVTVGLPIARTSPAHGTAFDIAGQGIASESSLVEAMKLAGAMCQAKT